MDDRAIISERQNQRVVGLVAYDPLRDVYVMVQVGEETQRLKPQKRDGSELTPRELQVLHLVADGLSNEALARKLNISLNTSKRHLQSIFLRLGVSTRSEAVARAIQEGWLKFA
jgi:DNA-binding NarL/FixJ family response regulator